MQREKFSKCFPTRLLAQEVTPPPSARNLGIVFDSALHFKSHISGISRACYYHIRGMRRIRRFLPPSVAKTFETSLICDKLDYCNSVVFNVTAGCTNLFGVGCSKVSSFLSHNSSSKIFALVTCSLQDQI